MSVDAAGSKDELDLAYVGREANPATHGASIMEPGGWPNGSLAGSQPARGPDKSPSPSAPIISS